MDFFPGYEPKAKHLKKISSIIFRDRALPGITADEIARRVGVSRKCVLRHISNLRQDHAIHTYYRTVDGKRTAYYSTNRHG